MNDGQIINDLEKISDFGIKLINSARKISLILRKKLQMKISTIFTD